MLILWRLLRAVLFWVFPIVGVCVCVCERFCLLDVYFCVSECVPSGLCTRHPLSLTPSPLSNKLKCYCSIVCVGLDIAFHITPSLLHTAGSVTNKVSVAFPGLCHNQAVNWLHGHGLRYFLFILLRRRLSSTTAEIFFEDLSHRLSQERRVAGYT